MERSEAAAKVALKNHTADFLMGISICSAF
jgi:hypothetical protein